MGGVGRIFKHLFGARRVWGIVSPSLLVLLAWGGSLPRFESPLNLFSRMERNEDGP